MEKVCAVVVGVNHMISEKQKPMPGEKRRRNEGRRIQRRGGVELVYGFLKTAWPHPHLLPVVVVADGGQSLAYCHSPLKGQITSEHCLAGQVQKPLTPHHSPPPPTPLPSSTIC